MDKIYIKNIIQNIVDKEFTSNIERTIIMHNDRVNFRCPFCHEGNTKSKKRGNVYFNKLRYVCFRCGENTSFDKLCKKFGEQIDPTKKLEMIEHLNSVVNYKDVESDYMDFKLDDLIDINDLIEVFNRNLTPISEFKPVVRNGYIFNYLLERGITPDKQSCIYQAKYYYNEDRYEWIIVMLNKRNDKLLSIQIRNLKQGKNRMFRIYNYENLLEWIKLIKPETKEVDMGQLVIYNKLSYYFNILNIDFESVITVFEGYIDSLFYPNSIGMVGINTNSNFLENNNLDIQYFFDNDKTGHKKSEEKLRQGFRVFLWHKMFEDIVDKKSSFDPYSLMYRISKVKDLNKLAQTIEDPYNKLKLGNYFSQDLLDVKWIPKAKEWKRKIIQKSI
jgi:hypothetical protein